MADTSFIGYVGDADFHDGEILTIDPQEDRLRVRVRGYSGTVFIVDFGEVRAVRANKPEGMVLYSLSEFRAVPPLRHFDFTNWDDDSLACLEVDAETIAVRKE